MSPPGVPDNNGLPARNLKDKIGLLIKTHRGEVIFPVLDVVMPSPRLSLRLTCFQSVKKVQSGEDICTESLPLPLPLSK